MASQSKALPYPWYSIETVNIFRDKKRRRQDFIMNNLFDLKGKWALVTGGSRGIGKAIALGLAHARANIVISATNEEKLKMVAAEIESLGSKVIVKVCDMADPNAIWNLFQDLDGEINSLDILVNNAGIIRRFMPAEEFPVKYWDDVIQVNLKGLFIACQQFAKRIINQRGKGKIINITSVLGLTGGIAVPSYAASKGGVIQLTKALANEWASKGINVNAIAPGYFQTELTEELQNDPSRNNGILSRIPAGRWGKAEDIQGAAIFLASSASDYVNGHVLTVDGGWMAR